MKANENASDEIEQLTVEMDNITSSVDRLIELTSILLQHISSLEIKDAIILEATS
jgi:hypothetical protein